MRHTIPPIPEPTAPRRWPRLTYKRVLARGERLARHIMQRWYLTVPAVWITSVLLALVFYLPSSAENRYAWGRLWDRTVGTRLVGK
jgi:hypothetical protein